jgi:hypothetical protein
MPIPDSADDFVHCVHDELGLRAVYEMRAVPGDHQRPVGGESRELTLELMPERQVVDHVRMPRLALRDHD